MSNLDLLDKKIMYELDCNARIPASQLAKKLKKSKETIIFRINRLLNEEYIKGFYSIINTSKLGYYYIKLYIKFRGISAKKQAEFFAHMLTKPHLAYLGETDGSYDCMLLLMVKNPLEMMHLINEIMASYGEYVAEKEIVTFLSTHRLAQRFVLPQKKSFDLYYPYEIGDYELQDLDKKILSILATNARMPLVDIAAKLGVHYKVVKYRMNKLEKEKIILGYVTSPGFAKLRSTFFQVNIALKNPSKRREVIEFFNNTKKALYGIELLGKYDVLVEVHVENAAAFYEIMDEFKEVFRESYSYYDTFSIKKEYTMVWSPFE